MRRVVKEWIGSGGKVWRGLREEVVPRDWLRLDDF